jgi:hypothetical protein
MGTETARGVWGGLCLPARWAMARPLSAPACPLAASLLPVTAEEAAGAEQKQRGQQE